MALATSHAGVVLVAIMSYRTQNVHVVYLHGFASSPASSKAMFLKNRLLAHGVTFNCPDLNQPDFFYHIMNTETELETIDRKFSEISIVKSVNFYPRSPRLTINSMNFV